ncbi:hypothetical protein TEA_021328 [Camellia sinensis var. sinensis]|uniref:AAA+ ATPase domain-containing protein n=1 Tax=Camellia sinensis var. sinensis TaxID=542762 RepID=A0A4S4DS44_CAMSN|nr:hypothetical protein TEA_021328 [Camellia sinensis var. sinensis]
MTPPYSVLYNVMTPPYSVLYNVMTPPYSVLYNVMTPPYSVLYNVMTPPYSVLYNVMTPPYSVLYNVMTPPYSVLYNVMTPPYSVLYNVMTPPYSVLYNVMTPPYSVLYNVMTPPYSVLYNVMTPPYSVLYNVMTPPYSVLYNVMTPPYSVLYNVMTPPYSVLYNVMTPPYSVLYNVMTPPYSVLYNVMTPPYSVLYNVMTPPYSVLYNVMTPPYSVLYNVMTPPSSVFTNGVPSPKQRYDILLVLLSGMEHSLTAMQVQHLAMATHGFVGADLAALCNEAALVCLRCYVDFQKSCDDSDSDSKSILFDGCNNATRIGSNCSKATRDTLDSASSSVTDLPVSSDIQNGVNNGVTGAGAAEKHILKVAFEDFEKAKMKVRPSAMREVILEVPKVNWEDVGGQKEVKTQLMEAVEWPQKHHDAFKRIGTRPPTGVLLFGPPGCSKTLLARAVASEAGLNFLAVKGPELFSKWVGESEKAVRSLFAKARANAPSVIFFDEIDGLAVIRGKESDGVSVADRVMSQLLVELDGMQQRANVTVIAATNRPDKIDPALLRPGRFDRLLYVGPPSESDREDIFRIHLRKMPCSPDICINELALLTEGCTGADLSLICREAALAAIEENLDASEIRREHLKTAIEQVQPSEIQSYQELSVKFQRLVHSSTERDVLHDQPCSRSNWNPFWTLMKSVALFFHQFPASLSQLKPSSSG